ncbi:ABC transporter ATP-binding protein [Peribacillus cavernae]|uniref:ABC transporter ATP-binding protein n=1 Tax=Peribacillus cavernae TaxID=1674310 RepID=A0A3S0W278_9BACI|nr:ABC transporter ATP-binding protein [Peribacillus cavernae]MDQ0220673.1 putative hydroxymethylpyrimidine transport system ATP-binding protein [Peribacillus cavernae]RUQ31126.1 ABC transporter ATP-binding protein [Peribacillus cavernae]
MDNTVLEFNSVTFSYSGPDNDTKILDSLDFRVQEREFVSIIGASGSGKSTLFRLISGLEQPSIGEILINGNYLTNRLGHVGYMPQQDLLMPWRTIVENAALPLQINSYRKDEARKQVTALLDEFGLSGYENRYPGDLSGGMKQRVSFLRTILTGAPVLLLDEPFSALDAITRLSMQEWLMEQWEKRKKTILFITHDVNEALYLSDRIFVFNQTPVHALEEIKIPMKRPRNLKDLNRPEMIALKDRLLDQLRLKVKP